MKEGRDFEVFPGVDFTGIRIISGKYKGVIYQYDKIALKEGHFDIPMLSFHYTIHESGKISRDELKNDINFHNMIGDIIVDLMISNRVERETYESDRTDYPEELGI